jgi:hypothetical protein
MSWWTPTFAVQYVLKVLYEKNFTALMGCKGAKASRPMLLRQSINIKYIKICLSIISLKYFFGIWTNNLHCWLIRSLLGVLFIESNIKFFPK